MGVRTQVGVTVINARARGASGNNSADDTSALNACITEAGNGAQIFLPNGKYRTTSTLTTPSGANTGFVGESGNTGTLPNGQNWGTPSTTNPSSMIVADPSMAGSDVIACSNGSPFFRHVAIASEARKTGGAAIKLTNCKGFTLHDVWLSRMYDAIIVGGTGLTWNGVLDRVHAFSTVHDGLAMTPGSGGVIGEILVSNTQFNNGNEVSATGAAIRMGASVGDIDGCLFNNLDLIQFEQAVIAKGSTGFWNNLFFDTCNYGVVLDGAKATRHLFSNAWFASEAVSARGQACMQFINGASQVRVSNSLFKRGQRAAQFGDCSDITIADCNITHIFDSSEGWTKTFEFLAATEGINLHDNRIMAGHTNTVDFGAFTHTGMSIHDNRFVAGIAALSTAGTVPSGATNNIHHNIGLL